MIHRTMNRIITTFATGSLIAVLLFLVSCSSGGLSGQGPAAYLEQVRHDPVRLEEFVRQMPKGGDLHTHLAGVPYAESLLAWAAADGKCMDTASWTVKKGPCTADTLPVSAVLGDPALTKSAVDAFSMNNFPLNPPKYGHDHFFATFSLFDEATDGHTHNMLAEAATRAANDTTDYLELLHTLFPESLGKIAGTQPWTGDIDAWYEASIDRIRAIVPSQMADVDTIIARQRALLACQGPAPPVACDVTIRFIQQVIRTMPNTHVFASLILGAEMAAHDMRIVGVDLVAPEDDPVALANYTTHMKMLGFLKTKYPSLKINLHAGELNAAIAGPSDLSFHVTQAIKTAGAQRIGHGVAIRNEPGWQDLLKDMAHRRIGVAMLFTSNAQILGVTGDDHPFRTYMAAGVPVMISTDDQGVSRGSHTGEFLRAITTYNLPWKDITTLIRNSLDISFLAGRGLWKTPGVYTTPAEACASDVPGSPSPSPTCKAFLKGNDKAAEQWRLEGRLAAFEKRWQ
jgi:adenosine deaminase